MSISAKVGDSTTMNSNPMSEGAGAEYLTTEENRAAGKAGDLTTISPNPMSEEAGYSTTKYFQLPKLQILF